MFAISSAIVFTAIMPYISNYNGRDSLIKLTSNTFIYTFSEKNLIEAEWRIYASVN